MPEDRTIYITFENLMDTPEKILQNIYNFLEVNTSAPLIEKILNTPTDGVRRRYTGIEPGIKDNWQKILTEKQIKYLNRDIAPFYSKELLPVETLNPN